MLQSKAGYIDARPISQVGEASCNARPDHTFGSKPVILRPSKMFSGLSSTADFAVRDLRKKGDALIKAAKGQGLSGFCIKEELPLLVRLRKSPDAASVASDGPRSCHVHCSKELIGRRRRVLWPSIGPAAQQASRTCRNLGVHPLPQLSRA
jgi:hypothetical protein